MICKSCRCAYWSKRVLTPTLALCVAFLMSSCNGTSPTGHGVRGSTSTGARLQTPQSAASCLEATPQPASGTRWAPPVQTPGESLGTPGAIAGRVNYPSSGIPAQLVYALSTAGPAYGAYSTETVQNQPTFTILGVAPGTYFVYSAVRPLGCTSLGTIFAAAYTDFVECGLINGCSAHRLLPVAVRSGATTGGVDVFDWYADASSGYPPPPSRVVPAPPVVHTLDPPYDLARTAALAIFGQYALMEDSMSTCPVNRACASIGEEHAGIDAAYFVGAAGSNADIIGCGTYVYKDNSGWRGLRSLCQPGAVFPAEGQSGAVWAGIGDTTSCVHVRSSPGSVGPVVGCLQAGTPVRIDDGPVYSPMASMDGLWWHVASRGWMADDYLR